MKKLVVINFDNQYINTANIITDAINKVLYETLEDKAPIVIVDDVECELDKSLELLSNNIFDEFLSCFPNEEQIDLIKQYFGKYISKRGILPNGLQEFLQNCYFRELEVVIITNKPVNDVKKCIQRFTPNLIKKVEFYKEPSDGVKLIDKLVLERNLSYKEVLIISHTDFNDEYLEVYEYSTYYEGDNIFNDYTKLTYLLDEGELEFPSLGASFDITVDNKNFDIVKNIIESFCNKIEVIDYKKENKRILSINYSEVICKQENGDSMYLENLLLSTIKPFRRKSKLLNELIKEYKCDLDVCVTICLESSKINPCISTNKEIIRFLAKNNVGLHYEVYYS